LLHINPLPNRALVINRLPTLLHVDRWRRRRSTVNDRRLRLSDGCADGGTHGKTTQSSESHGGTGRQAITRCRRLGDSQAGDQRQSRGRTGNKTEDLHDHHPDRKEATCPFFISPDILFKTSPKAEQNVAKLGLKLILPEW
jgi:hypothetical protein